MKGKVVTAVGTASGGALSGVKSDLGKAIEAAMVAEVEKATVEGIVDPDVIRDRKLAARARVKAEFAKG